MYDRRQFWVKKINLQPSFRLIWHNVTFSKKIFDTLFYDFMPLWREEYRSILVCICYRSETSLIWLYVLDASCNLKHIVECNIQFVSNTKRQVSCVLYLMCILYSCNRTTLPVHHSCGWGSHHFGILGRARYIALPSHMWRVYFRIYPVTSRSQCGNPTIARGQLLENSINIRKYSILKSVLLVIIALWLLLP